MPAAATPHPRTPVEQVGRSAVQGVSVNDPRNHRRYLQARKAWLAGYQGRPGTCCLCGQPVNTSLPGTHRLGPTIEHRLPIRVIRATAQTWAECVALACDTSLWGLAHRRCQSRQGQAVTTVLNRRRNAARKAARTASRDW